MSTNAITLDQRAPRPAGRGTSPWRRAATAGLALGLVCLLAGDRGARSATPVGIDPLDILNLSVRANAFIILDSSGSMRDTVDFVGFSATSAAGGQVVGDDPQSKMFAAKQVLKQVIQDNQTRVSFEFGRYQQDTGSYGPETTPRFLYSCKSTGTGQEQACTSGAADRAFNLGTPTLSRAATDERTVGGVTTYFLFAETYRINRRYLVRSDNTTLCSTTTLTGSNAWSPPSPATDWNLPTHEPPFIEIERTSGNCAAPVVSTARFYFRGIHWSKGNNLSAACGGYEAQVGLAACSVSDQFSAIGPFLHPEVVPSTTDGASVATLRPGSATGIRASGPTPIAESLIDIRTLFGTSATTGLWGAGANAIKNLNPKPRTFVIVLTDGDDSCSNSTTFVNNPPDDLTLRAAHKAQLLYAGIGGTPDPASRVRTFVVVFGAAAAGDRADWIAWGGTGLVRPTTGSGNAERWAAVPSQTDRDNCATCVDAFLATDAAQLSTALQQAIDLGQSAGEFSDQQSITESVYELVGTVTLPSPSPGVSPPPSPDPLNPVSRYSSTVPVLLQSTFELPNFVGHLNAFRNVANAASPAWGNTLAQSDAGQKLFDRVVTNSLTTLTYTFDTLRGGATSTDQTIKTGGTGTIRRRIYTTPGNGVFLNSTYTPGASPSPASYGTRTEAQRVQDLQDNDPAATAGAVTFRLPIWPPTAAVDPAGSTGSYPQGILDDALGIGPNPLPPPTGGTAPAALTFAELQSRFGACTRSTAGGALPPDCSNTSGTPSVQLQIARKEARQAILAYTAGAAVVFSGGQALRTTPGGATDLCRTGSQAQRDAAYNGSTCGALQYRARPWIMAESTLAAPGVVAPPLELGPGVHNPEYTLYRDGPRTNTNPPAAADTGDSLLLGFGLRNPDKDGPTTADTTRLRLKPVMSVVYHATNHMLHAFRAGPCRDSSGNNTCLDNATETGGEELWAFVPHDQLQNLKEKMRPQSRDNHTYMIATPIRFGDVFVPGAFSRSVNGVTVSGDGVWRTIIVFGRGIAGKYYTALDVTAPGPFTEGSLSTRPFIPLWSRGNPDTRDGTAGGTANNTIATGPTDGTQYAKMGQTWSVPAFANVNASENVTDRTPNGVEFVGYTGSGFGSGANAAAEGSTFFTLDLLTGDVVASVDVGDRSPFTYDAAIVAGPSAFNESQLTPPNIAKVAVTPTTRVYFGDNNGRVWRVFSNTPSSATLLADLGPGQPVANSVALLNYKGSGTAERPHLYVAAGNDSRVTPSPSPFKFFGLRDDDLTTDPNTTDDVDGPVVRLYSTPFTDTSGSFRGNVSPATVFNDQTPPLGRVFFAGNRFNGFGTTPPCASSFDSILFAVAAETGNAAYDLNATGQDKSITKTGQRIEAVRVAGGRLVVDTGLGADLAPPPPQPPAPNPPQPSLDADIYLGVLPSAMALRNQSPVTFKVGSSICK